MTFDVHPGVAMVRKWAEELPAKTGRSLEQWADEFRKLAKDHPERKDLVTAARSTFNLGTNTAGQLYEYTFGQQTWDGDPEVYLKNATEYVHGQYAGAKSVFVPLFEAVVSFARSLGSDVKVCPCKTMVPLYRQRVFAEMRAATQSRFELALCLVDVPYEGRLEINPRAKGKDRQRHRVSMTGVEEFDQSVQNWLRMAYEQDG